jgi:hypothetical protein
MGTHLSYSQISLYLDCSRRWQAKYRQNRIGPVGEALLFGSTAHTVIEQRVRSKERDMLSMWETAWAEAMKTDTAKITIWKETPEMAFATGVRMFSSNEVIDIIDGVEPMLDENGGVVLERKIEYNIGDGVPVVEGYIDCMGSDGVPWDFKTASAMWPDSKPAKEIQPLIYLAALNQLGETNHNMLFRHLVITKAQTPRVKIFETQRSLAEIEFLNKMITSVWRGIAEAHFIPNPMAMYCNEECPIWLECAGKKE